MTAIAGRGNGESVLVRPWRRQDMSTVRGGGVARWANPARTGAGIGFNIDIILVLRSYFTIWKQFLKY